MAQQDEKALNREEKLKALEAAIVKLEKDYGKGAVMKLGDGASMNRCRACAGSRLCEKYRRGY